MTAHDLSFSVFMLGVALCRSFVAEAEHLKFWANGIITRTQFSIVVEEHFLIETVDEWRFSDHAVLVVSKGLKAVLSLTAGLLWGSRTLPSYPVFPQQSLHSSSPSQRTELQAQLIREWCPQKHSQDAVTHLPGQVFVSLICVSADVRVRYYTPGW